MSKIITDICIIGGGSAGLSVASGAAQLGAKVVLLEGHKMGGDCLNYGCIPSKALIAAGKHAHAMTVGKPFGIMPAKPIIDFGKVKEHVKNVIQGIEPHDSIERFKSLGVNVIAEYGQFISPTQLRAGNVVITARRFVVSTGSSPFVPPIEGLESTPFYTNENIFDLKKCPEHLLIIGGGPIGMEMAQAHVRLGSKVTVLEGIKALGREDPEIVKIALDGLKSEGVNIIEGSQVSKVTGEEGAIIVETENGLLIHGTHLLVAIGRKPNLDQLNLNVAGIELDRGNIKVNASLKTTNNRIYAIGDVVGDLQFTHMAEYHAGVVIRSALFGLPSKKKTNHIPWATYLDPEIAQVGLTEVQALKMYGKKVTVVRAKYSDNDRARTELSTNGLVKVMVVSGRPVGASIVGKQAGELIQIWALAISSKLKMSAVSEMVSPYPTLGEVNKRAANAFFVPKIFNNTIIKRIVRLVQKT